MDSRVGELSLTVRAQQPAVDGLLPAAEAFAIRVLQRCDEMLEQRHAGRVFVLRHLDLSLPMIDGALEPAEEIDGIAAEIADHLERATMPDVNADPANDAAVFADEAAWHAAHVEAHARGATSEMWKFAPLDRGDEPLLALARDGRLDLLREVLSCLHHHRTLLRSLEALPEDVLGAVAGALGQPGAADARQRRTADGELPNAVIQCVRDLAPAAPLALVWIAVWAAARDALGPSRADTDVRDVAERAFAMVLDNRSTHAMDRQTVSHCGPDDRVPVASAFGGVFYLLRLALEVSVGEILWRACLPEGIVLSRAVRLLLSDEDAGDPAPILFGAVGSSETLPPVLPEQQREVSQAVFACLVDVLRRRELAMSCSPLLHLADTPHGRMLVASAESSSYVLFALPANSREEVAAALDDFLAIWPSSARRPRAGYALAALDRRGRISSSSSTPSRASQTLIAPGDSLCASALLTQAAGTLGYVFAARLGVADRSPRDLVDRYFQVPALVATTAEALDVRMAMEAVNIDVRRAGLDADPGWIPWLGRRVSFTFEEEVVTDPFAQLR